MFERQENKRIKEWAESLDAVHTPLENCAKAAKKIKDLLEKYDQAGTDEQKSSLRTTIIKSWKEVFDDAKKVHDKWIVCFSASDCPNVMGVETDIADRVDEKLGLKEIEP